MRLTARAASARTATVAALIALVPLTSACTITIGESEKKAEAPAAAPAAPAAPTASETTQGQTSEQSAPAPLESPAAGSTPSETTSPSTDSGSAATSSDAPVRQKVEVPAGHGIQSLDLIDIYGGSASGGGNYGRVVAVFKATTDRPLLIKLRLHLFDKSGKEIATNDGLNPAYIVGTRNLVTSNLIKIPAGTTPHSFKASLVDTTDMREPVFTQFDQPKIGTRNGVPSLTGSFSYKGKLKSGMDSRGACVLPDGKIIEGQDGLTDNPTTASGDTQTGTYDIPLYDAKNMDLSKARCYASV